MMLIGLYLSSLPVHADSSLPKYLTSDRVETIFIADSYGNVLGQDSWPYIAGEAFPSYAVFAKGGAGFSNGRIRFSDLVDAASTCLDASSVRRIIIGGGTNDGTTDLSEKDITDAVQNTVQKAKQCFPNARIYVLCFGHAFKNGYEPKIKNTVIKAYKNGTENAGATYIASIEQFLSVSDLGGDYVHPKDIYVSLKLGHTVADTVQNAEKLGYSDAFTKYQDLQTHSSDVYFNACVWAYDQNMHRPAGTSFGVRENCTRSDLVYWLWKLSGSPAAGSAVPFTDIQNTDADHRAAIAWAYENHVTSGTSPSAFSPDKTVTRAQMVTFLWNAAGRSSVDTTGAFVDVPSGSWYEGSVSWAVSRNITSGTGNQHFSPYKICTTGQALRMLFIWQTGDTSRFPKDIYKYKMQ